MQKKLIIGLSIFLVILIVISILLFNSLRPSPDETNPTPGFLNRSDNTRNTSQSGQSSQPSEGSHQTSTKSLTPDQRSILQQLTNSPVETDDFSIRYSPYLARYIIEKKTHRADMAIAAWARNNNMSSILTDPQFFIVKNTGQGTYQNFSQTETITLRKNTAILQLPLQQQAYLEEVQETLPHVNTNFNVDYSQSLDTYIIESKTPQAPPQIETWARNNNLQDIVDEPDIFLTTTEPIRQYERELEIALLYGSLTPTPGAGGSVQETQDLLEALSDIAMGGLPTIIPTPDVFLTLQPTGIFPTNTELPTPTIPGTLPPASDMVTRIVQAIGTNCSNATVLSSNTRCLNPIPLIGAQARSILVSSANLPRAYALQCVGFVKGMVMQTTRLMTLRVGDAKHQLVNQDGYRAIMNTPANRRSIKPGDLVVWTRGTWGHIAYVTRVVDAERGVIELAEANIPTNGKVRISPASLQSSGIAGWLTPTR